jgi:hypothetical protein
VIVGKGVNSEIISKCEGNDISLKAQWIPRSENIEADRLNRKPDCDDWGIPVLGV